MFTNYFSKIQSNISTIPSLPNLKSAQSIFHHHYHKHVKASNTACMTIDQFNVFKTLNVFNSIILQQHTQLIIMFLQQHTQLIIIFCFFDIPKQTNKKQTKILLAYKIFHATCKQGLSTCYLQMKFLLF